MKLLMSLLVSTLTLMLAACGPIYETQYSYQPPHSDTGRMCAAQCVQNKSTCHAMCEMRKQTCLAQDKQNALVQFEAYKTRRIAEHRPVDKTPVDFENSWNCNQACGCGDTFNMCYQTCGGVVTPHRECVAFCDKK